MIGYSLLIMIDWRLDESLRLASDWRWQRRRCNEGCYHLGAEVVTVSSQPGRSFACWVIRQTEAKRAYIGTAAGRDFETPSLDAEKISWRGCPNRRVSSDIVVGELDTH